MLRIEHALK